MIWCEYAFVDNEGRKMYSSCMTSSKDVGYLLKCVECPNKKPMTLNANNSKAVMQCRKY